MKVNSGKIKIIILFFISLTNYGCSAQNYEKKDFYSYINEITNEHKFIFFKISLIKKCKNEFLFGFAKMNYNDNLSERYKIYNYKGSLIIFDLGIEKDKKIINFFDSFFKQTKIDISKIPKGRQSIINEKALYFIDKNYIGDLNRVQEFLEKDCQ